MKKILGDLTILHMSTKNYDHMIWSYVSWDMVHNRWTQIVTYRGGCPPEKYLKSSERE